MKPVNREFFRKCLANLIGFTMFGLLFGTCLTRSPGFVIFFLILFTPYLVSIIFARFNVHIYLLSINYTMSITFLCLISAIVYTLLPPENAAYYYDLTAPENFVMLAFCTLPFVALTIYMLRRGCKNLDEITLAFIKTRRKININKAEYYMNQKLNMLSDITKKNIYDSKLEKFLEHHTGAVCRVIVLAAGLGPAIPILISRSAGQQPLNYFFLFATVYVAWLYAYFIPIAFKACKAVLYIQKKYNIKLKLAYKNDDDVIIV